MGTRENCNVLDGSLLAYFAKQMGQQSQMRNWPIYRHSLNLSPFHYIKLSGEVRHSEYRKYKGGAAVVYLYDTNTLPGETNDILHGRCDAEMISDTSAPFEIMLDVSTINKQVFIVPGSAGYSYGNCVAHYRRIEFIV